MHHALSPEPRTQNPKQQRTKNKEPLDKNSGTTKNKTMTRLKYILTLTILILSGFASFSQSRYVIDEVCIGAERYYRVDGQPGSTYIWTVTEPDGVTVITLPETADTCVIFWNFPAGAGTYSLATEQTNPVTGCTNIELGLIIVYELPVAYAGVDVTLCAPMPYTLAFADTSYASTLLWTTGGDGTFNNDTILQPEYTFGANDILNGTVTLTLTAQGLGETGSCPPAESSVIITLDNLVAVADSTPASCPVVPDGTVTLTASGGTGPYTYILNTSPPDTNNTGIFTGLAAGTYAWLITDASGCEVSGDVTVNMLDAITATVTYTNETFPGASNGTVTVNDEAGGSGVYEYKLVHQGTGTVYDWQASDVFTGLPPGFYEVWIRDLNAPLCEYMIEIIEILPGIALTAELDTLAITCYAAADGQITVINPLGGSGLYEYMMEDAFGVQTVWQTSNVFGPLGPGTYIVYMRDQNEPANMITVGTVILTDPAQLAATYTFTNETYAGANDGSITVDPPTGGSGNYEYMIVDAFGTPIGWQASNMFTGLIPGTYDVWIRDADNIDCEVMIGTVVIAAGPMLMADVTYDSVTCYGAADGSITVSNPQGGSGNYEYMVEDAFGVQIGWQSSGDFSPLAAGTYIVRMRDADVPANAVVLETVIITEAAELMALVTVTDESYAGANDGIINITGPQGGSGTYEYMLMYNPPPGTQIGWQSSAIFTGLAPGTYEIYMRDSLVPDCFVQLRIVDLGTAEALTAEVTHTDVTCYGYNNGSITVSNPLNGSGFYEYNIGGAWQSSGYFGNLPAGPYTVTMRDSLNPGNFETLSIEVVGQPEPLWATVILQHETLAGANDGSIVINAPTGGSGFYEYMILLNPPGTQTGWQSSGTFAGLAPGIYEVYMRDVNDTTCMVQLDVVEILPAGALGAEAIATNVTCFGFNDGTITVSAQTGGSGNYQYSNDGGLSWQDSPLFTGLAAGTYIVMMRDADQPTNLITIDTFIITAPDILYGDVVFTNDTCDMDGTITVLNSSGGWGTYEYSINGFIWQSDTIFTGLNAGFYFVYMRDSLYPDCYLNIGEAQIENTCALTASVDHEEISCFEAADGTITVTNPEGGSGNYSYSINGIDWQTSGNFTNLGPGTYTVMIRDNNDPSVEVLLETIILTDPAQLAAIVMVTNETFPGNNGMITVTTPTGGSGTYEYMIEDAFGVQTGWQASNVFASLAPGTYTVWMRDANNIDCLVNLGSYEVLPEGALTALYEFTHVTCFGANDGTITIYNPQGGTGVYEYSINGGLNWQTSGIFTDVPPGTYVLMIRDEAFPANAITLATIEILEPEVLFAEIEAEMIGCTIPTGSITFTGSTGGSGNYEYSIDDGNTWQTSNYFGDLPAGDYDPIIRDAENTECEIAFPPVTITESAPMSITINSTDSTTCDEANGAIDATADGGSGTYEYMLENVGGSTTPWQSGGLFTDLSTGNYRLTVHDDTGCEITYNQLITIEAITPVEIINVEVTHSINGGATGTLTVEATSPALPLQYSLDSITWQLSNVFTDLPPGFYTVYVMDANGCVDIWQTQIGNVIMGEIELVSGRVTECVGDIKPLEIAVYEFDSISSFRIQLTYDPLVLKFVGFGTMHYNLVPNLMIATEISPGVLEISYTHPGFVSVPDGELLVELMVQGIAPGESQLDWQWLECIVMSPVGLLPGVTAVVNEIAEVFANPTLTGFTDGDFCPGDSTIIWAEANMDNLVYTWTHPRGITHDGPVWDLGTLSEMDGGNYIIEAKQDQCYSLDTVNINVFPNPLMYIAYEDTLCFGNPIVLDPRDSFAQYEWSTGSTMPTIIAYEAGVYWLKVVDINGCRAIDTVTLEPCLIEVLIPNAFTPNNDGLNDTFKPIFTGFEPGNYRMDIYSKWGQLLFTTATLSEGWDGRVNGDLVSPDTFVYVVSYEVPSYVMRVGLTSPITGRVSVIR